MSVCVCVSERERKREKEREGRERGTPSKARLIRGVQSALEVGELLRIGSFHLGGVLSRQLALILLFEVVAQLAKARMLATQLEQRALARLHRCSQLTNMLRRARKTSRTLQ